MHDLSVLLDSYLIPDLSRLVLSYLTFSLPRLSLSILHLGENQLLVSYQQHPPLCLQHWCWWAAYTADEPRAFFVTAIFDCVRLKYPEDKEFASFQLEPEEYASLLDFLKGAFDSSA